MKLFYRLRKGFRFRRLDDGDRAVAACNEVPATSRDLDDAQRRIGDLGRWRSKEKAVAGTGNRLL